MCNSLKSTSSGPASSIVCNWIRLLTYVGHKGEKGGSQKKRKEERIARGSAIDMDTRLRVGRALAKTEEEVGPQLMQQIKRHAPEDPPPAMSTDGKGAYRQAMLRTWGKVPAFRGRGKPPTLPKPDKDWH
jgi:hypothetical protein